MTSTTVIAPPAPPARLNLAITGHREGNAAFAANRARIESVLAEVLDNFANAIKIEAGHTEVAQTRFHCMLSEGADLMAAEQALARGWELIAPLAFGLDLNVAINALPITANDARAMIAGEEPDDASVKHRSDSIRQMAACAHLFELADRDEAMAELFVTSLQSPDDKRKAAAFSAESSLRVELAARVMIEHADILIAIWDGVTRAFVGGTGHTVQLALEIGAPVVWIDAHAPDSWRILSSVEELASLRATSVDDAQRGAGLHTLVHTALSATPARRAHSGQLAHEQGPDTFNHERWHARSNPLFHGYRRIEALFGGANWKDRFRSLRQNYETPEAIADHSAAGMVARARHLPGQDCAFVDAVAASTVHRFAWADGIAAYISDTYRGGMTLNFLLAPLAIVIGITYLPIATSDEKWIFATLELAALTGIVAITLTGQRRRWQPRWFETRRVAEYLRHAPIMLMLGVVRAPAHWPKGAQTSWPEWYARRSLREAGLPRLRITQTYVRDALHDLLDDHVVQQRDYHLCKARRLATAHHRLDKLSEALFAVAVIAVTFYLLLKLGGTLYWWPKSWSDASSLIFTFLGVALPTLGSAVAGIRYFGDFERFASISEVTAEKLSTIHMRIRLLLDSPDAVVDYGQAAELARAVDDVVIAEIESWQAVFAGKHVAVPV
jgi:hypothetical protein